MARLLCASMLALFMLLNAGCSFKLPNSPMVETTLEIGPVKRTDYDSSIDAQLATLVRQLENQLSGLYCKNVGILQVVDLDGEEGTFEKYIKDELVNRLSRGSQFRVFPIDDLPDDSSDGLTVFSRITSLFQGKSVYLTGTTVDLPKGIKVGVQIASMETEQVLGSASMMFQNDRSLMALAHQDDKTYWAAGVNAVPTPGSYAFSERQTGKVIKVSDNDYVELVRNVYTIYIKKINHEYNLFTDAESTVEIFLNDDYRIMSAGDMVNLTYGTSQFVLTLHRVTEHKALFTFANLSSVTTITEGEDQNLTI